MKGFFSVLVVCWCFTACEKTIDLQPLQSEPLLVVDGVIETGDRPIVVLTRSLNYFSSISAGILENSFVQNALVTINDGTRTYPLKVFTQMLPGGYRLNYYSTDTTDVINDVLGQNGKTYTLNIQTTNARYVAQTSIPVMAKTLDSLWWKPAAGTTDSLKAVVMTRVTDPPGFGNYIRYFTRVNRGPFLPGANSAFDDQIVDGTTYEVQVDQGINRNDPPKFEDYGFFARGDTVTVKFTNIDKATFDYWRTLEYSYQSLGNPFSSPVTVLGNVNNGALGAFCGYAVQYKSLIIPR